MQSSATATYYTCRYLVLPRRFPSGSLEKTLSKPSGTKLENWTNWIHWISPENWPESMWRFWRSIGYIQMFSDNVSPVTLGNGRARAFLQKAWFPAYRRKYRHATMELCPTDRVKSSPFQRKIRASLKILPRLIPKTIPPTETNKKKNN